MLVRTAEKNIQQFEHGILLPVAFRPATFLPLSNLDSLPGQKVWGRAAALELLRYSGLRKPQAAISIQLSAISQNMQQATGC
jgi:hypothetical protein